MPNDVLSLPPPGRRMPVGVRRISHSRSRFIAVFAVLASSLALPGCGGEEDPGVTYNDDVRPIFNRRCTNCHRPGGPSGVDIQNPFNTTGTGTDSGLVASRNFWKQLTPSLAVPEFNVLPGDPDASFLMNKISPLSANLLPRDPDGQGPLTPPAGLPMPLQIPALTQPEVNLVEDWIRARAPNGNFTDRSGQSRNFDTDIRRRIFGDENELRQVRGVCDLAGGICARCIYCHYQGTPNPPDLSNPFGPDGLVGVNSIYTDAKVRVAPGDPDASFLMDKIKVENRQPDATYGAPMPYSYSALNSTQLNTVRQWILEGARP
jgi:hypothetical protein